MPLIKKLLLTIFVFLGFFFLISLFLPSKWEVHRSIEIKASAAKVFPYINDLHKWSEWYPWFRAADVSRKVIFEGPDAGQGAVRRWAGSSGKNGRIEILRSVPLDGVWYSFKSDQSDLMVYGSLQLKEKDGVTIITWQDTGDTGMNIFARISAGGLDTVVGKMFEQGLENLKKAVEK